MIPELGNFALILAAVIALVLGTLPLIGAHNNRLSWVAVARPATSAMALLITFSFAITDTEQSIPVHYKGILPDLFKEGKGAVAQGKLNADGTFVATEVLAKHDENYMPPEAAKAVDDAQARAAGKHVSPSSAGAKPGASY